MLHISLVSILKNSFIFVTKNNMHIITDFVKTILYKTRKESAEAHKHNIKIMKIFNRKRNQHFLIERRLTITKVDAFWSLNLAGKLVSSINTRFLATRST